VHRGQEIDGVIPSGDSARMTNPTDASRSLVILGRELRLRSEESPEHLDALAQYVETCATEIARGKSSPLDVQVLLATALQLADEVFKLKREQSELLDKLRSSSRTLLGRLGPNPTP
jgi:cell division protein ZapA (FtsZ GTPase activity inhibitor)